MSTEQQVPESSSVLYPSSFTKEDLKIIAERTRAELLEHTNLLTESWFHDGKGYLDPDQQVPVYAASGNTVGLLTFNHEWVDSFRENWQRETQKQVFMLMCKKGMDPNKEYRWNRLTMQEENYWPFDQQGNVDLKKPIPEPSNSGDLEVVRGLYAACYDKNPEAVGQRFDSLVPQSTVEVARSYLREVGGVGWDAFTILGPVKGGSMVAKTPVGKKVIGTVAAMAWRHKGTTVVVGGVTAAWLAYQNGWFDRKPLTQEQRGQIIEYQRRMLNRDTEAPLSVENPSPEVIAQQNETLTEVLNTPDRKQQIIKELQEALELSGNVKGTPIYEGYMELIRAIQNNNVMYDKEGYLVVKEGGRTNLAFRRHIRAHSKFCDKMTEFYLEHEKEKTQQNVTGTIGQVSETPTPHAAKTMGQVGEPASNKPTNGHIKTR